MDSAEEDFYCDNGGSDWADEGVDNVVDPAPIQHYKVLKQEAIKQLLENDISTVSGVLSVSRSVACTLLCENNWSLTSVYENWFSVEASAAKLAAKKQELGEKATCKICYEKITPEKSVSTTCGHPFCRECWVKYIARAINVDARCLTLRCPEPGCKSAVGLEAVEELTAADDREKYYKYLQQSYVERNRNMKWCPAAGCDRAIELDVASECDDVSCECSHKFCWRCEEQSHRPMECKTVAEWLEKNLSEEENTKAWILAYTKPCPKCSRAIEKNKGCNKMKCGDPCMFEFCWVCLRPWKNHGGKYATDCENKPLGIEKNARKYMERYTRYHENERLRKIANSSRSMCDERVVSEAWQQIVECRRVLKWSYAYGYYLSLEEEKNSVKLRLLECLQGHAEASLERLEKGIMKKKEDDLAQLTSVTRKYFQNLVAAMENNLCEVENNKSDAAMSLLEGFEFKITYMN